MYLRGSKWNMNKRSRKRSSPIRIFMLLVMIAGALYLQQFVVPSTPQLFVPTPTPTISPEAFANDAQSLFADGKLLPAIEAYQKAIRSDPTNKANYVAMAQVQVWAGQYEEAVENAERALVNNENYALAHAVRGWALGFQGEYLEAKAALKRSIELDPNSAVAHAYYAEVLADSSDYGDIELAIEESRIAYDLDPSSMEALRARGYVLFVTDNREESIAMFEAALRVNKNIADIYLYLGYNYKAMEQYDLAIDAFRQANSLNPANDVPDLEASRIYALVGDFGKAVQYAELAVNDASPDRKARRYGWLGIMHYKSGNYSQAIDFLALAVHGGTAVDGTLVEGLPLDYGEVTSYYVYYGLALTQVVPSRCSEAVPVFQAIITGVPDDADNVYNANYGMGLCRDAVGEEDVEVEAEPEATATP